MKKIILLQVVLCMLALGASAQKGQLRRPPLSFPDVMGYKVLKGDFHLHTLHSDGSVKPLTRAEEAYAEDMNCFAISDHFISRWHLAVLNDPAYDFNKGYKEAKSSAEMLGLTILQSAEVSRDDPFGHYCTIGIKDANAFRPFVSRDEDWHGEKGLMEIMELAYKQGAFIQWNHPGDKMFAPAQAMIDKKILGGIEVANGETYYPEAFQWCLDNNLSIMANTDAHETMAQKRDADGSKVMTLVLAKEQSESAILEALKARRTIALWNNTLIGREEHLKPLVMASLSSLVRVAKNGKMFCEITNIAGVPFYFEVTSPAQEISLDGSVFNIRAYETTGMSATTKGKSAPKSIKLKVKNAWIAPGKCLEVEIPIKAYGAENLGKDEAENAKKLQKAVN